jgi:MFS superfamily sulfate permease-like transporter
VIGSLTFVNGEGVVRKVAGLANPTAVILDLADTRQVDTDGLDQLEKAVGRLLNGKVPCRLEVCGLTKELSTRLQNYKWFQTLESEGLVREGALTSMTSEKNEPLSEARKFSKTSVASDQCSTRSPSENGIPTPDVVPTAPVHAGDAV